MNSVCESCHRLSGSVAQIEVPFNRETKPSPQPNEQKRSFSLFHRAEEKQNIPKPIREQTSIDLVLCENCIAKTCYDIVRERRQAILYVVPFVLEYINTELSKFGSKSYVSQEYARTVKALTAYYARNKVLAQELGSDVYKEAERIVQDAARETWKHEKERESLCIATKQLYSKCPIPRMSEPATIDLWPPIWERLETDCQQVRQKDVALAEVANRELELLKSEQDFVFAFERGKLPLSFFSIRKIRTLLDEDWVPGVSSSPKVNSDDYSILDFSSVLPEIHREWGGRKGGHTIQMELEMFFAIYTHVPGYFERARF